VLVIPAFLIMKQFWLGEQLPGADPAAGFTAFGTFLLRQYFRTLPIELRRSGINPTAAPVGDSCRILVRCRDRLWACSGLFTFIAIGTTSCAAYHCQ